MEYARFGNKLIARIDKGEEILAELKKLCARENITLATVSAIGAVGEAETGWFDTAEKKYYSSKNKGIYEIASLSGTVSTMKGEIYLHIHCLLAGSGGEIIGGHLSSAVVSATCEVTLDIMGGQVDREFSQEIGLNLFLFKK